MQGIFHLAGTLEGFSIIVDSHDFIAQPEAVELSGKGHSANILALQKFYHGCHSYSLPVLQRQAAVG